VLCCSFEDWEWGGHRGQPRSAGIRAAGSRAPPRTPAHRASWAHCLCPPARWPRRQRASALPRGLAFHLAAPRRPSAAALVGAGRACIRVRVLVMVIACPRSWQRACLAPWTSLRGQLRRRSEHRWQQRAGLCPTACHVPGSAPRCAVCWALPRGVPHVCQALPCSLCAPRRELSRPLCPASPRGHLPSPA